MHADQNPRTGEFAKSNVASFLAPLFFPEAAATAASSPQQAGPQQAGPPQAGPQDFYFPVIEDDWVSVVWTTPLNNVKVDSVLVAMSEKTEYID